MASNVEKRKKYNNIKSITCTFISFTSMCAHEVAKTQLNYTWRKPRGDGSPSRDEEVVLLLPVRYVNAFRSCTSIPINFNSSDRPPSKIENISHVFMNISLENALCQRSSTFFLAYHPCVLLFSGVVILEIPRIKIMYHLNKR